MIGKPLWQLLLSLWPASLAHSGCLLPPSVEKWGQKTARLVLLSCERLTFTHCCQAKPLLLHQLQTSFPFCPLLQLALTSFICLLSSCHTCQKWAIHKAKWRMPRAGFHEWFISLPWWVTHCQNASGANWGHETCHMNGFRFLENRTILCIISFSFDSMCSGAAAGDCIGCC